MSDLAIPRPRTPDFQALYADLFAATAEAVERLTELAVDLGGEHTYHGHHILAAIGPELMDALRPGGPR